MRWTVKLIKLWIELYDELKEYHINPWKEVYYWRGEAAIKSKGSGHRAPFENLAMMNAEFDLGIKALGKLGSQVFRLCILEGKDIYEANKLIEGYGYEEIRKRKRTVRRELIDYLLEMDKE